MSISGKTFSYSAFDDLHMTFDFAEYAIGGKLVTASATMPAFELANMLHEPAGKDELKEKILKILVNHILEKNLVSFTKMENILDNTVSIVCRMYLAPDDQIKILRMASK